MNKLLLFLTILIISSCSLVKNDNQFLESESVFKNGVITQTREYYKSGRLESEVFFDKSGKIEFTREYHENGKLAEEFHIKDKKYIEYNDDGRTVKEKGDIDDLTLSFLLIAEMAMELSKLTAMAQMPDGKGVLKEYYENGVIKEEVSYKNGKLNGVFREYFEDGALQSEGYYKNGYLNGVIKEYYSISDIEE